MTDGEGRGWAVSGRTTIPTVFTCSRSSDVAGASCCSASCWLPAASLATLQSGPARTTTHSTPGAAAGGRAPPHSATPTTLASSFLGPANQSGSSQHIHQMIVNLVKMTILGGAAVVRPRPPADAVPQGRPAPSLHMSLQLPVLVNISSTKSSIFATLLLAYLILC